MASGNNDQNNLSEWTDLKFIWLDTFVRVARLKFTELIDPEKWTFFDKEDACIAYIQSAECKTKPVFLVSSGRLGQYVVPKVHDLPQFYAAYIHCADIERNTVWSQTYNKVKGVYYDDEKEIFPKLAKDVSELYVNMGDKYLAANKRPLAISCYCTALEKRDFVKDDPSFQPFVDRLTYKMK
ncbi:unnamed protein product [Didymodactylos carnosus]|uniref:Uncharacterized protein n=1 Tax=Didymodactylos carnosus TaxID=1234261 RepID=A0A815FNN5_9BILA|nr:unnamed protein product [Didymodactylos carnosus]CAF1592090.1 unnamed protein product [Didymodactylos carnosus]CAF4179378.1 unnamed protein product [Didymodactylos carnosus]CAF4396668.1 unnamed protein product [Didymodactylos carnosus]